MLKPAEMTEFRSIFPQEKKEEVVKTLHETGKVQLESVDEHVNEQLDLSWESSPDKLSEISSLSMEIDRILEIFDRAKHPEPSKLDQIKDAWNEYFTPQEKERKKIEIGNRAQAIEYGRETVENIGEKIKETDKKLEEAEENIPELKEKIESVKICERFNLENLSLLESSQFVYTKVGSVPVNKTESLKEALDEELNNEFIILNRTLNEGEEAVIITTLSENESDLEGILSSEEFDELSLPSLEGDPEEVRKDLQKELEEKRQEKERQLQKIEDFSEKFEEELLIAQEVLEIEKERASALNNFSKTDTTTILQGWMAEDQKEKVKQKITESADGKAHVKTIENESEDKKEPPTILRNPPILENFEVLTKLFGTPGKGEIDPTPLLALTYVLFFGIMLTDIAYGAITLLLSIGLLNGFGRTNETVRDFSIILILGSSATIISGLITGSLFGNVPTYLTGGPIGLYNPIENPMPLLLLSLVIGLVHEYLGIAIGLYEEIEKGDWKTAMGDRLSWLLLIPGAIVLIMQNFGWGSFSSFLIIISGILVAAGIILIIYSQGPLGIMDVFSMLGNILSYTRIMALALVTSALALTFNQIVGMIWGVPQSIPILGIALGIFLFTGAHLFSLVINLLSSFVHSLRLHYVEFFDKFFRGTGESFKPFQTVREHTRIE